MKAEWLTPAAVLAGALLVSLSVVRSAAHVVAALDRRALPVAQVASLPGASPAASPSEALPLVTAASPGVPPPALAVAAAAPGDGGVLELPIVTFDSFDRRFNGKLQAEAEARCWASGKKQWPADDVVYLYLDVATDGRVERAEPRVVLGPQDDAPLRSVLERCVAELARRVVFMRLPEPVKQARVAAHRPRR